MALGPELPALYSTDDHLARDLMAAGIRVDDPLWHLPLWSPYDAMMNSKIADVNNAGTSGFAGSITAALFLYALSTGRNLTWTSWRGHPRPPRSPPRRNRPRNSIGL
ncbi:hypothetical protein [Devosia lacusdianchii]|uniref:hypothetical protein n=1 Tax=Devosia lacusdianchii TaxID=2917991 RepID=UPI003B8474C8